MTFDPWDAVWFCIGIGVFFLFVPMRGGQLFRWLKKRD